MAQFHKCDDVFDEGRSWKYRVVLASFPTTTGAIVRAMLAQNTQRGPAYGPTADVFADGQVWTKVRDSAGRWMAARPIGHIHAVRDSVRRLADFCRLGSADREALFEELRKWIRKDFRARSES